MNNLFTTYKKDILEAFKKNYKKMVLKNPNLEFNELLNQTLDECNLKTTNESEISFLRQWFLLIHHLHFLHSHMNNPFQEIIIHSPNHGLVIGVHERNEITVQDLDFEDYQLALETLALKQNQKWNYQSPFVSFAATLLGIDYRVTLVHFSCTSNEISKLFIRSQPDQSPDLGMFNLAPNESSTIERMIKEQKNFLISGGTGSGKTTFLRSLLPLVDSKEHLIVLEDTYEIKNQHPGQTSMLAQKDNSLKTLKEYCAYALRMSPDRLIIGEMRSSEVVPFILAMNTGHKGLMSTIHANSAIDAIHRAALLFTLYSETRDISYSLVLKLLSKSIDYVIHLEDKKIKEIVRIIGSDGDTPYFEEIYSES